jgi:acyl-coenzyme A thioesterase PaaI-like protein
MNFQERLKGQPVSDGETGEWHYHLDRELNGGFGGTNGGVLAAICVNVSRKVSPGRQPIGIDARFIRGFRPGVARVIPTILNEGRTLTTVSVDIIDDRGKLATRGTVSLVNPDSLGDIGASDVERAEGELKAYEDGRIWREPPKQEIPLIRTFSPRFLGRNSRGTATAVDTIWTDSGTLAEASCIAADISVGPPVAAALGGKPLAIPNPDLSLRFTGASGNPCWLLSTCRLESFNAGVATTSLEVRDGARLVAVGVSTTTCLKS